jgi:ABC-type sugar transport system substrate-binding protein
MSNRDRRQTIIEKLDERGFISVKELSDMLQVSEMTIRRDLELLDSQKRIQRTFGGAAPLHIAEAQPGEDHSRFSDKPEGLLVNRVDVLISTSLTPKYDSLLLETISKKNIPIIAESVTLHTEETVVAVDNDRASRDLGNWVGNYALKKWGQQAIILDLTYFLSNTQARSRGFLAGVREVIPNAEVVLSLNAQSRYDTAYQLTRDALTVHKNINIIFAINDSIAWGAINACKDLGIDRESLIVVPFGLEGDTLKNALKAGDYCKIGLAMFPEIVGPVCVEAAIAAYNRFPLPRHLLTPYAILTSETLPDLYTYTETGWQLRWEVARNTLSIPIEVDWLNHHHRGSIPRRIGFIVPFRAHEWYKNLIAAMQMHASQLKIEFEIVDADQS